MLQIARVVVAGVFEIVQRLFRGVQRLLLDSGDVLVEQLSLVGG